MLTLCLYFFANINFVSILTFCNEQSTEASVVRIQIRFIEQSAN